MRTHQTAAFTAVWRYMAGVDTKSIKHVSSFMRVMGWILGKLDPNSVQTIAQRTSIIDGMIKKKRPKYIVEIGAGYTSRSERCASAECVELDVPHFKKRKKDLVPYELGAPLQLKIKEALFIVEGVSMYVDKEKVEHLLKEIRKYKGAVLIDFFTRSASRKEKTWREKLYKIIFSALIGRESLFDYTIKDPEEGKKLFKGFKNVSILPYSVKQTLDVLYYAEL